MILHVRSRIEFCTPRSPSVGTTFNVVLARRRSRKEASLLHGVAMWDLRSDDVVRRGAYRQKRLRALTRFNRFPSTDGISLCNTM